jgi:Dockerin type I domain
LSKVSHVSVCNSSFGGKRRLFIRFGRPSSVCMASNLAAGASHCSGVRSRQFIPGSWPERCARSTGPGRTLATVGLTGDYNHNGVVDAADYTVWRDSLGSTTNLAADGNGNGVIDSGDYTVWKTNFGNHSGSGSSANVGVPEPSTFVLLLSAILTLCFRRCARVS